MIWKRSAVAALMFLAVGCGEQSSPLQGTQSPPNPTPVADIRLVDVAPTAGLTHPVICGEAHKPFLIGTNGTGAAVLDYDRDGLMDLYVVNGSNIEQWRSGPTPNRLYHNLGDGTFAEVAAELGVDDRGWGSGALAWDYDNDGDSDLYVTNYGPNRLYRNDDGDFTEVAADLGLADLDWSMGAAAADMDLDGDLDLYVAHYIIFDADNPPLNTAQGGELECKWKGADVACGPLGLPAEHDRLFRNDGEAGFTDISEQAGIHEPEAGFGMGVVWIDANSDGLPDVYVANDASPNLLFMNRGKGRFEEVGYRVGAALGIHGVPQSGMGIAVGDMDGDLDEDIFVTNFSDQANALYSNDGQGFFDEVAALTGIADTSFSSLGWGATLFDVEGDGDMDLYVANGHVFPEVDEVDPRSTYHQRDQLFLNNGFAVFDEHRGPGAETLERKAGSRGVTRVDIDNDGDSDLLVVLIDDAPVLLRNDTPMVGGFIGLSLVGTDSPNDPAMARVRVHAAGEELGVQMIRLGSSYMSSEDPRLLFAVADHDPVEVEVRWPAGSTEHWSFEPGKYHRIQEGTGSPNPEA